MIGNIARLLVFLAFTVGTTYAAADHCNDILKGGVFETIVKQSSLSADQQTYEWLKTVDWQQFEEKQQAGLKLTLPVDGSPIPVGADGTYSREQFQQFLHARDEGKLRFFKEDEFSQTIEHTASKVIADKWLKCMEINAKAVGLQCWSDDDERENGIIEFNVRYISDEQDPSKVILPVVLPGGLFIDKGSLADSGNFLADNATITLGLKSVNVRRNGRDAVAISLRTTKGKCDGSVDALPSDMPNLPPALRIKTFSQVSTAEEHPHVTVTMPSGFKVIGGGALANWRTNGSLLIASRPEGTTAWFAQSKDHSWPPDKGGAEWTTITGWAIGLYDPKDEWDVSIKTGQGPVHTAVLGTASASLDSGYVLTGGGAWATSNGPGILLTASYPDEKTWRAAAKDHGVPDDGTLTAYVIGIKPKTGPLPTGKVFGPKASESAPHPSDSQSIDQGWLLTGGGARTDCNVVGNLLTASYPIDSTTWRGEAKDHGVSCPSPIWVYAVGLKPVPGSTIDFDIPQFEQPSFLGSMALTGVSIAPRVTSVTTSRHIALYVTRRHDTMRKIAMRYYGNFNWRRIYDANATIIKDPMHLKAGLVITIP
jgi:LysM domain